MTTSSFRVGPKWNDDADIPTNQLIQLRPAGAIDSNGVQRLQGFYQNENNVISVLQGAGTFNANTGEVFIAKGVAAEPFNVVCSPRNSVFDAKQHMVSKLFLELNMQRVVY